MGFSQDQGYTPATVDTLMGLVREGINTQFGTSYTAETFVGTNFYKYFYALIQRLQASEVKTSEIFLKLQQYIALTNERISRPVVTPPGLIEKLESEEYDAASVKPMIDADAGKISICVDVDDGEHAKQIVTITNYANLVSGTDDVVTVDGTAFTAQAGAATPGDATFQAATSNAATATSLAAQINAHATIGAIIHARAIGAVVHLTAIHGGTAGNAYTLTYTDGDTNVGATVGGATFSGGTDNADYAEDRLAICEIIRSSVAAGIVSQGTEEETIVLSNGQSFDFKFFLPERIRTYLKLTLTLSENNQSVVLSPEEVKDILLANIAEKYKLGKNFEPQRYFTTADAPWTGSVLLEWSWDETTWSSAIYEADFDELLECGLADVTVVEV